MNDEQFQRLAIESAERFYTSPNATPYSIFLAGWNAAVHNIGLLMQAHGGDGCYCVHHPDDPAHTKDCYDLIKALTGE